MRTAAARHVVPRISRRLLVYALCGGVSLGVAHPQGVQVVGSLARQTILPRGGEAQDQIVVQSVGGEPVSVRVYQTDYTFGLDSAMYGDAGTNPRSNASWVTFTPQVFELPPHATTVVRITTKVPADETLHGTYWSMLMVEPQAPEQPLEERPGETVIGIRSVCRYGIQVATTIAGTGQAAVTFPGCRVALQDGVRQLAVDVENSGDLFLRPTLIVKLRNRATGKSARTLRTRPAILYPGCATTYRLDVTALAPGAYDAQIVADNGDSNAFGARARLQFDP